MRRGAGSVIVPIWRPIRCGSSVARISGAFLLVGDGVALVGDPVSLVGDPVSYVGVPITPMDSQIAQIGVGVRAVVGRSWRANRRFSAATSRSLAAWARRWVAWVRSAAAVSRHDW